MTEPGPPSPSAAVLLGLVQRAVDERLERALAEVGLTRRHLGALGHLRREPGLSLSDLARRARVTPQSMHATVGDLETRGWVGRGSAGRGRRAGLEVTAAGLDALAAGTTVVAAVDGGLRDRLGAPSYDALVAGLLGLLDPPGPGATPPTSLD